MPSYYEKIAGMFSEESVIPRKVPKYTTGQIVKDAFKTWKGWRKEQWPFREMSEEELMESAAGFVGGGGTIKRAKLAGPRIREVMAKEFRSRGAKRDWMLEPEITHEGKVKSLLDYVTRGPWFHGRRTYPKAGETFGRSRISGTNLGEPTGLSLTGTESIAAKFAKEIPVRRKAAMKLHDKLSKLLERRSERFDVSKTGQKAWDEYAQGITASKRASNYGELQRLQGISTRKLSDIRKKAHALMPETKRIEAIERSLDKLGLNEDIFARVVPRFGAAPTDVILPAWKGPGTEYAQEILKDAYSDAARVIIRRKYKPGQLQAYLETDAPQVNPGRSLADVTLRNTLDTERTAMNEMIVENLQKKGYKGLLYSPRRFDEFELKMMNPQDVMMLDLRKAGEDPGMARLLNEFGPHKITGKGRQTKRLDAWRELTGESPHSLRDIYNDIDLLKLHDEVMEGMPKAPFKSSATRAKESFTSDLNATMDAITVAKKNKAFLEKYGGRFLK